MHSAIKKNLPNTFTCLNLFSGCIACTMAYTSHWHTTLFFVLLSAVFDFLDGLLARKLNAYSLIGKDLDSLADDISFGLVPSLVIFTFLKQCHYVGGLRVLATYIPYTAFLIAIFSALRLAKFNNDTRQTSSFRGLPVPANALFWCSLIAGSNIFLTQHQINPLYLVGLVCISSLLLVCELPMFSLKFKTLKLKENTIRLIFLLICVPLLVFLKINGFAAIIVWYILLSLITAKNTAASQRVD